MISRYFAATMKKLVQCALVAVLLISAVQSFQVSPQADLMLSSAAEAAVDSAQPQMMFDHYGDPERFVKYIIRKPPTHA